MDKRSPTTARRRVVVDQRDLARTIGSRIRTARLAAGLTQQQLAGDRYTKAYVSALELGHAKPSMAALDYLAPRLGTTPDRLLADQRRRWTRVDADLHLASGRYREAADAYRDLADGATEPIARAELLLGAGEAYARLRLPVDAAPLLAEARTLLEKGGRTADRIRAQYWQAWAHQALDDPDEARRLLLDLLSHDLSGADDPDIEVRVRIALATIETDHGSPELAALYLEEAKGRVEGLDLRKRAVYFDVLATARYESGDAEGAIRAALEAISLYRTAEQAVDLAVLENRLALTYLAMGNTTRAEQLVEHAISVATAQGQEHHVGRYLDTQAVIHLSNGDATGALSLADQALEIEARIGPPLDQVGARISRARALTALGRLDEADVAWRDAGAAARQLSSPTRRKRIFSAWAEALAAQGRHAEAYEVMREAL